MGSRGQRARGHCPASDIDKPRTCESSSGLLNSRLMFYLFSPSSNAASPDLTSLPVSQGRKRREGTSIPRSLLTEGLLLLWPSSQEARGSCTSGWLRASQCGRMGVCALAMELHRKGVCSGTEARLSSVFDLSLKTEASGKNRHHILFSKHLLCSSSLSPAMKMIPFFFSLS